jgi:hypothetical protein
MSEVDQATLDRSLEQAFAHGRLPFCHDPSYRLEDSDRRLCSLRQAELQRCPALKQECAAPAREAAAARRHSSTSREHEDDVALHVPRWLGAIAEVAFWAVVAALLVAFVASLVRMRRARHDEEDDAAAATREQEPSVTDATVAVSGDRDVARLLDTARRAAERGDHGAAIDAAHAAAVQGLSATGHVEVDLDRTNGDYLRELRKVPLLQQEFKAIVGQVEVAQFGGATPTRGAFDRVMEQVTSLLRRLAVLSSCLLALLAMLGCSGGARGESGDAAPSGLYTLKRILSDQGGKVHTRVAPLTKLDGDVGVVLLLSAKLEASHRNRLLDWVDQGGSLIVAGSDDFMDAGEVALGPGGCGTSAERGPNVEATPLALAVLGEHTLRVIAGPDSVVAQRVDVTCGGVPYIVTSFLGDGSITFIPERELLSNASLSVADNARLVAELLSAPGSTIELVGPWTGDGSQSPVESLKAAGMLPALLQLLALALLLALRQGTSFGARRDDQKLERRAFADHVRALASTYARAGAGSLVSGHYGLLLIDQLRERLCPGQAPTLLQLAAVVARRVRRPETEIVQLLVEAKTALDDAAESQGVNHELIRELERLSLQAGGIS